MSVARRWVGLVAIAVVAASAALLVDTCGAPDASVIGRNADADPIQDRTEAPRRHESDAAGGDRSGTDHTARVRPAEADAAPPSHPGARGRAAPTDQDGPAEAAGPRSAGSGTARGARFQHLPAATDWPTDANGNLSVFGDAVAIEGDVAAVGRAVSWHATERSGAAFVYERSGGTWALAERIDPPPGACEQGFGAKVAVDRGRVFVFGGAPRRADAPRMRVYDRLPSGVRRLQAEAVLDGPASFLLDAAVSGDVAVVACNTGRLSVLRRGSDGWRVAQSVASPGGEKWADRVDLVGDTLLVLWGARDAGSVVQVLRDDGAAFVPETPVARADASFASFAGRGDLLIAGGSGGLALDRRGAEGWTADGRHAVERLEARSWTQPVAGSDVRFVVAAGEPRDRGRSLLALERRADGWWCARVDLPHGSARPAWPMVVNVALDGRTVAGTGGPRERGVWFVELTGPDLAGAARIEAR